MASPTPITLHYDERLVSRAVLTFWRRKIGVGFFIPLLILVAAIGFLFAQDERGWLVGASISVVVLGVTSAGALFIIHYRGSMMRLRRMNPPEAIMSVNDDVLSVASSVGSSTLRWSTVSEVWETADFWLLFFSPGQFITLPTADIPMDTLALIRARVAGAGGRVA